MATSAAPASLGRIPSVDELVGASCRLASPAGLVAQIVAQVDDDRTGATALAATIARDSALAAKLVRLANSARFSPASQITTIERAVTMLGLRSVKLLALTLCVDSLLPGVDRPTAEALSLRRRSLVNALVAREFVNARLPVLRDEVFFVGLVGHLGRLTLAQLAPGVFRHLEQLGGGWFRPEDERAVLGCSGDEVTAAMLSQWRLPARLVDAIRSREADTAGVGPMMRPMVDALRMGLLGEQVLCGHDAGVALVELRRRAVDLFGLEPSGADAVLVSTEPALVELAAMLDVELPPDDSHTELLRRAMAQIADLSVSTAAEVVEGRRRSATLSTENDRLTSQSRLDPLTGLANRGTLDDFLQRHLAARSRRDWSDTMGLLILDLDRFKEVNDTWGHTVGDDVLRAVGALLRRVTRRDEFAARYGGEEFVLVLPHTSPAELIKAADRIRREIAHLEVPTLTGPIRMTASIGGACTTSATGADPAKDLVDRADAKLYEAKRSGRDTCCLELPAA